MIDTTALAAETKMIVTGAQKHSFDDQFPVVTPDIPEMAATFQQDNADPMAVTVQPGVEGAGFKLVMHDADDKKLILLKQKLTEYLSSFAQMSEDKKDRVCAEFSRLSVMMLYIKFASLSAIDQDQELAKEFDAEVLEHYKQQTNV